MKRKAPVIN